MAINIAIIGVGNCASSLVQCIDADRRRELESGVPFPEIGGFRISDIEVVAAFDVDKRKIGLPLSDSIFAEPNCTSKRVEVKEFADVIVAPGALLDGVCEQMRHMVEIDVACTDVRIEEVASELRSSGCELVVSYLPVGSQQASDFYAEAALSAGCGFINCTPAVIANSPDVASKFQEKGLVLLGDDIKSQFGSTALHRALINLLQKKGMRIVDTYQLNIGGNTDFQNMRCDGRAEQKKHTKEGSIRALVGNDVGLSVGPSDFVPSLSDHKVGYFYIGGEGILGMPFSLDMKIRLEDSPNSAGVVVNAVRAAKVASERGLSGIIESICPYFFKNPPTAMLEDECLDCLDKFLNGETNV